MSMELVQQENQLPTKMNQSVAVASETARAVAQVQAAMTVAKRFPRDEIEAEQRILQSCSRATLAAQAMYQYPRAGQTITGPSIRLAETIARAWGNIDCGVRELEQRNGESIMEAFCHDLETNYRKGQIWTVRHEISTKKGIKKLEDSRDIYEKTANEGARRLRACILAVIPGDVTERAISKCKDTLKKGEGSGPLIDRIRGMVNGFNELGVTKEMIEERLRHSVEIITPDEFVEYTNIFKSIRDRETKREDWFKFEPERPKASANEALGLGENE